MPVLTFALYAVLMLAYAEIAEQRGHSSSYITMLAALWPAYAVYLVIKFAREEHHGND